MTSRQKLTLGVLVLVNIVVIAVVLFLLQGNKITDDSSISASETQEAVVDIAETPEIEDNATETVDGDTTAEVSSISNNNNFPPHFDISVSYAQVYTRDSEALLDSLGLPPAGQKWVMVTGSLFNYDETDAVTIEADHLILITDSGEEYTPKAPNGSINPYLVDTELLAGESLYGFVVYAIPENETAAMLQWCPTGECVTPLEVSIALVQ